MDSHIIFRGYSKREVCLGAGADKAVHLENNKLTEGHMLNNKGFDVWADDYDKSVGVSDEDRTYPFAGYKDILNKIPSK